MKNAIDRSIAYPYITMLLMIAAFEVILSFWYIGPLVLVHAYLKIISLLIMFGVTSGKSVKGTFALFIIFFIIIFYGCAALILHWAGSRYVIGIGYLGLGITLLVRTYFLDKFSLLGIAKFILIFFFIPATLATINHWEYRSYLTIIQSIAFVYLIIIYCYFVLKESSKNANERIEL